MNKKTFILFFAMAAFLCFNAFSHSQPQVKTIKKPVKVLKKVPKPAYRFDIQGIKRIFTSPNRVVFQVQYYISPSYPKACYIGAYIPNKAHMSSKFALIPAGRRPNGVPKGQKHFSDNISFEMKYIGSGSYTSRTIEVVIYDRNGNLKTQVINWGQTWRKTTSPSYRFEIQGLKRTFTSSYRVRFQVQYFIDPSYPRACYISAYIPNKRSQSPDFAYTHAGRRPNGVPKGQKHFSDNINFTVDYKGDSVYTSRTIEVVIYDSRGSIKTQIINWGQTWDRRVY
jgi:hypothetical protein